MDKVSPIDFPPSLVSFLIFLSPIVRFFILRNLLRNELHTSPLSILPSIIPIIKQKRYLFYGQAASYFSSNWSGWIGERTAFGFNEVYPVKLRSTDTIGFNGDGHNEPSGWQKQGYNRSSLFLIHLFRPSREDQDAYRARRA